MTLVLPSGAELLLVLALTLVPCLAVAGAGALLLRRPGRRSLRATVLVSGVGAVAAVCAGVAVVSRAMFLSAHDLGLLAVVLTMAATVGIGSALLLARSLDRDGRRLVGAAAAVGSEGPVWDGRLPAITELAAVAEQLQRTASDLAQARRAQVSAEQARQELATWMSHDLRTPLAGIRAMAEALEDALVTDPSDIARYHRQVRVDAERLGAMVDDLFELSRLQAGHEREGSGVVDLAALVQDVAVGCRALDPARPVVVSVPSGAVVVRAWQQDVSRAVHNLVANALRYSPSGSAVQVRVEVRGRHAVVEVADSCGGLQPEDVARLFDVGFRGARARTPDARAGAGLGLAITRRLVEAHEGTVDVHPRPNGCCFAITLPLADAGVAADQHVAAPRSATGQPG